MAIRKPLVLNQGNLEQLQSGDVLASTPTALDLLNGEDFPIPSGSPIYISAANTAKYANTEDNKDVIAFCVVEIPSTEMGLFQVNGLLILTTDEWDARTGETGGLTPGAIYFLDDSDVARITKIAPTIIGHYVVKVGVAISTTDFEIIIGTPIKL